MSNNNPEGIHPAWNELLGQLPDTVQTIVLPHLKKWSENFDNEVSKKVQETTKAYEPYKVLVDNNVDMQRIDDALKFVYNLETEPAKIIPGLAQHFQVDLAPAPQQQQQDPNDPFALDDEDDMSKLEDNPVIKQLLEQGQKMQEQLEAQAQREQEAQDLANFDRELDDFLGSKPEYKVVPKPLLIAYMSQGATPEDAAASIVDMVKNQISPGSNGQEQEQQPDPVLMGGEGGSGSGIPNPSVDFGSMSKGETTDTVLAFLQAQQANNNQG